MMMRPSSSGLAASGLVVLVGAGSGEGVSGAGSVGLGAFAECYQLTVVNFMGNESQWNDVEVREYNELLNEAEIRFNA